MVPEFLNQDETTSLHGLFRKRLGNHLRYLLAWAIFDLPEELHTVDGEIVSYMSNICLLEHTDYCTHLSRWLNKHIVLEPRYNNGFPMKPARIIAKGNKCIVMITDGLETPRGYFTILDTQNRKEYNQTIVHS